MKIIAIISEYNPFHNGHKYQIDKIREEFGDDSAIIAIMSGSFTQRGEPSIMDKISRAECAVKSGVNLVLELPFPFSSSSAEIFAKSGVHIAASLGVVDHLSFGSESGDIDKLTTVAKRMLLDEYKAALNEMIASPESSGIGYATACDMAYKSCFGDSLSELIREPNNILAIEYIKALQERDSAIKPHTLPRCGAGYSDGFKQGTDLQSASFIRQRVQDGDVSALQYVPEITKSVYLNLIKKGYFPANADKLSSAVISFLRLNPSLRDDILDAQGGLYNRLRDKSFEANSISTLVTLCETKKYTTARIRRAMWNSYFGVTSSEVKALPRYTQLLGMDEIGARVLKSIKKVSSFPVITKPSSYKDFDPDVIRQKELSILAESVWSMTLPSPLSGRFPLTFTPFVKK